MKNKRLRQIQWAIQRIKQELGELGPMRPGTLTRQYRLPRQKRIGYYQLSYTYRMKSHTEYVRPQFVEEVRRQVATYKRFKRLMQRWIALGMEECRLRIEIAKRPETP